MSSAIAVCRRGASQIGELFAFLDVARAGVEQKASTDPEVLAQLSVELFPFPDLKNRHAALFATRERDSESPYLFGLATVQLWSILDACIEDVSISLILECEPSSAPKALQRLSGSLLEFVCASREEQAEILLRRLEDHLNVAFKPGIAGFEDLLNALGLGGPVAPLVRRALIELAQVRNVLAHRAGFVDKRLCERCPWLNVSPGTHVNLKVLDFGMYALSTLWYIFEIQRRLASKTDVHTDGSAHEILERGLAAIVEGRKSLGREKPPSRPSQ